MYIAYMAGRPPRQKAKNDARQQLCFAMLSSRVHNPRDSDDAMWL